MLQLTRREQLGAIILVVLLLLGLLIRNLLLPKPAVEVITPPETPAEEEQTEQEIVVHVAGAVHAPGVYTLPAGSRVYTALEAAGGVLPEADQHALNLAEPLLDGRRITVPFQGEQKENAAENGNININTATAAELQQLPGIGPAKAAAIIAEREKNGPFQTIDELTRVSGIGPNTLNVIRDYLSLY